MNRNLSATLQSISAQTDKSWRCVIVANIGHDLPSLPEQVEVKFVDFPPNTMHEKESAPLADVYEAIRFDKGRRVLAGMIHAFDSKYYMVVDDDDFVSRDIVAFVQQHSSEYGWFVRYGYVWDERGSLVFQHDAFDKLCGSCLIIRSDLYELPQSIKEANIDDIKNKLGSHVKIIDMLSKANTPLKPLPFRGAIYRIGHIGSHSKSAGIFKSFFATKELIIRPHKLARRILRIRWLSHRIRQEFMGQ